MLFLVSLLSSPPELGLRHLRQLPAKRANAPAGRRQSIHLSQKCPRGIYTHGLLHHSGRIRWDIGRSAKKFVHVYPSRVSRPLLDAAITTWYVYTLEGHVFLLFSAASKVQRSRGFFFVYELLSKDWHRMKGFWLTNSWPLGTWISDVDGQAVCSKGSQTEGHALESCHRQSYFLAWFLRPTSFLKMMCILVYLLNKSKR